MDKLGQYSACSCLYCISYFRDIPRHAAEGLMEDYDAPAHTVWLQATIEAFEWTYHPRSSIHLVPNIKML